MTSPGQLVKKISETLGIPEATVIQHDRNLIVAGLRTKNGRGSGAARVTSRDAAFLILSSLCSQRLKDSDKIAELFAGLRPMPSAECRADVFSVLKSLSLGDAISELIEMAKRGALQAFGKSLSAIPDLNMWGHSFGIEVTLNTSGAAANIKFWNVTDDNVRKNILEIAYLPHADALFNPSTSSAYYAIPKECGDRVTTQQITHKTIIALGELLSE